MRHKPTSPTTLRALNVDCENRKDGLPNMLSWRNQLQLWTKACGIAVSRRHVRGAAEGTIASSRTPVTPTPCPFSSHLDSRLRCIAHNTSRSTLLSPDSIALNLSSAHFDTGRRQREKAGPLDGEKAGIVHWPLERASLPPRVAHQPYQLLQLRNSYAGLVRFVLCHHARSIPAQQRPRHTIRPIIFSLVTPAAFASRHLSERSKWKTSLAPVRQGLP